MMPIDCLLIRLLASVLVKTLVCLQVGSRPPSLSSQISQQGGSKWISQEL